MAGDFWAFEEFVTSAKMNQQTDELGAGQAEQAFKTLEATNVFNNGGSLAAEEYTVAAGINGTVNVGSTTAVFATDLYKLSVSSGTGSTFTATSDSLVNFGVDTGNRGVNCDALVDCVLSSVDKPSACTVTTAYIYNSSGTLLESVSFSGDTATFSETTFLAAGENFFITADAGGGNYTTFRQTTASFTDSAQIDMITGAVAPNTTSGNTHNIEAVNTRAAAFDTSAVIVSDTNTLAIDSETNSFALHWEGDFPTNTSASFDLITIQSGRSFDFSAQETDPQAVNLSADGTSMYILGDSNIVFQYTLSTAFDVLTASFASKQFSVATQETDSQGLFFKDDGTSMYIVGFATDTVYQYTLSTAFDVSTASFASLSKDVSSEATVPRSLWFRSDGTQMYVLSNDRIIYQYTLSSAWDVSTASFDSKQFSVNTQETDPNAIFIKSDGTKLFVVGGTNDNVFQYSLSIAYDISTASYDSVFFNATSQEGNIKGLFFKSDGTEMYLCGIDNDTTFQYTLSTAWVVSSAKFLTINDAVNYPVNTTTGHTGVISIGSLTTISDIIINSNLATSDTAVTPTQTGWGIKKIND